jgi:hypothetical protein
MLLLMKEGLDLEAPCNQGMKRPRASRTIDLDIARKRARCSEESHCQQNSVGADNEEGNHDTLLAGALPAKANNQLRQDTPGLPTVNHEGAPMDDGIQGEGGDEYHYNNESEVDENG